MPTNSTKIPEIRDRVISVNLATFVFQILEIEFKYDLKAFLPTKTTIAIIKLLLVVKLTYVCFVSLKMSKFASLEKNLLSRWVLSNAKSFADQKF